jgi:hypothetical protein
MDDDGSESYVRVDGDLPAVKTSSGGIMPAYDGLGLGGTIWAPIMEKAFAYYRDPSMSNDGVVDTSYHNIVGGWMHEPMVALGGIDIDDNDPYTMPFTDGLDLLSWVQTQIGEGRAVTFATTSQPSGVLVGSHAYTVVGIVRADDGSVYLELRNPWGSDGYSTRDGHDDGYVFLTPSEAFTSMAQIASATV